MPPLFMLLLISAMETFPELLDRVTSEVLLPMLHTKVGMGIKLHVVVESCVVAAVRGDTHGCVMVLLCHAYCLRLAKQAMLFGTSR